MSDNFKPTKIGLVSICPEVTKGVPNWDLTADGGINTTTKILVDNTTGATHNDALALMVDAHLDYMLVYFRDDTTTALLRGEVYVLSTTARVTSIVTLNVGETMAAAPAATDRFVVFAPLQFSDASIKPGTENLPRSEFERQTLDLPTANKGLQIVSGSFKFELPGLEQENGNGDTPRLDRFSQLLRAMGTRAAYAGTTITAGSASTADLNVTASASMSVNDWIMVSGEATRITSIVSGTNILVSPALAAIPAAAVEVFIGEIITPDDTGHQSHTVLMLRDTQLIEARGCMFDFGVSGTYGQNTEASCEFDGEAFDLQDTYALDGQQSSKKAIPFVAGRSYFGTTALGVSSFEFALGHGRQAVRDTIAGQEQFITSRDSTLKCMVRNQNATPKETWEANGTHDWLFVQIGNAAGACIVIAGKAQIQDPIEMTDIEGHQGWDLPFAFRDDQTDFDTPNKPLFIRF